MVDNIQSLIEELGDRFSGLWIYREYDRPKKWSVTFRVNAKPGYFETPPCKTPTGALKSALRMVNGHK